MTSRCNSNCCELIWFINRQHPSNHGDDQLIPLTWSFPLKFSITRKQPSGWKKAPKIWNRVYLHCLPEELASTCWKLQNWLGTYILVKIELGTIYSSSTTNWALYTYMITFHSWLSFFCTVFAVIHQDILRVIKLLILFKWLYKSLKKWRIFQSKLQTHALNQD